MHYIPTIGLPSYLKIDSYYELLIQMLDNVTDSSGEPVMIRANRQRGSGELRDHVQRCDQFRERKKQYRVIAVFGGGCCLIRPCSCADLPIL